MGNSDIRSFSSCKHQVLIKTNLESFEIPGALHPPLACFPYADACVKTDTTISSQVKISTVLPQFMNRLLFKLSLIIHLIYFFENYYIFYYDMFNLIKKS
jgi:hypothetical protein